MLQESDKLTKQLPNKQIYNDKRKRKLSSPSWAVSSISFPPLTMIFHLHFQLRDMVPTRRPEKKMSKLQIHKSATKYINFLTQVLQTDQAIAPTSTIDAMTAASTGP